MIFDTDYGPFIDDVFALGLIANSGDLLDLKYVLTTSENPSLSAQCTAKHLSLAAFSDVQVGKGASFPDYALRGGVCSREGFLGFALEEKCNESDELFYHEKGIETLAMMLDKSDRKDWWYIVVGGQSSVKVLIEDHPSAASKISTLIVMGGNWCSGDFEPYPDVASPTDETNIACDPGAANFVLDSSKSPFDKIYYVPVVVAAEIGGDDYIKVVEAAESRSDSGAAATIDFYKAWSEAARKDESLLIHKEAMKYDPETESTPQFDACAVMLALELLDDESCDDRLTLFDIESGVHFYEPGDDGLKGYPDEPRIAFSLLPGDLNIPEEQLPGQCPALTEFTFDPKETPEIEKSVTVALGFNSEEAKKSFYGEMAERMAGTFSTKNRKCFKSAKAGKKGKTEKKTATRENPKRTRRL